VLSSEQLLFDVEIIPSQGVTYPSTFQLEPPTRIRTQMIEGSRKARKEVPMKFSANLPLSFFLRFPLKDFSFLLVLKNKALNDIRIIKLGNLAAHFHLSKR